jgi:transposase InsO family protein
MLFFIQKLHKRLKRRLDVVAYLTAENLALRQQLIVLKRNQARPSLKVRDRAFWKVLSQVWPSWRDSLVIVQPETVIGWQRRAFRFYWRFKSRGASRGRPKLSAELKSLVLKLSAANPLWGAPRIHGADMVAVDFLVVPTIRFKMLFVFVVLSHDRRHVVHFNVTANPTAQWTAQQITEAFPWDSAPRYLLRDRDQIFGNLFQQRVLSMGIEEVLTAYRSPWQNAYIERLNGSIRRECTDHIIAWNERHLKRILRGYFDYYNNDRSHLGLAKESPVERPISKMTSVTDQLLEMPRLGGLHHRYEWREAA